MKRIVVVSILVGLLSAASVSATSAVFTPPPAEGICPSGWDLIWIDFLPTEKQRKVAKMLDSPPTPTFFTNGLPALNDGYVCIKKPPPHDPAKQPITHNYKSLPD